MQVKLKVIGGKNDGREIRLSVPEFVIGRGEEAHLKPSSDLISRKHCSVKIENGSVVIADMGSRNGTFVNGEKIEKPHDAKSGDTLRVGRLQFEVVIDHAQPGTKKPRVAGVADAAKRTAVVGQSGFDEGSITDWLADTGKEESSRAMQDTVQFSLEETPTKMFTRSDEISESIVPPPTAAVDIRESDSNVGKKKYKKLPFRETVRSESTKNAADDVLRKFFNRR